MDLHGLWEYPSEFVDRPSLEMDDVPNPLDFGPPQLTPLTEDLPVRSLGDLVEGDGGEVAPEPVLALVEDLTVEQIVEAFDPLANLRCDLRDLLEDNGRDFPLQQDLVRV